MTNEPKAAVISDTASRLSSSKAPENPIETALHVLRLRDAGYADAAAWLASQDALLSGGHADRARERLYLETLEQIAEHDQQAQAGSSFGQALMHWRTSERRSSLIGDGLATYWKARARAAAPRMLQGRGFPARLCIGSLFDEEREYRSYADVQTACEAFRREGSRLGGLDLLRMEARANSVNDEWQRMIRLYPSLSNEDYQTLLAVRLTEGRVIREVKNQVLQQERGRMLETRRERVGTGANLADELAGMRAYSEDTALRLESGDLKMVHGLSAEERDLHVRYWREISALPMDEGLLQDGQETRRAALRSIR